MVITAFSPNTTFQRLGIVGGLVGYILTDCHSSKGAFSIWVEDTLHNRELLQVDNFLVFKEASVANYPDNMLRNTGTPVSVTNGSNTHPYKLIERAPTVLHSQRCRLGAKISQQLGDASIVVEIGYTADDGSGSISLTLTEVTTTGYEVFDLPKRNLRFTNVTITGSGLSAPVTLSELSLTVYTPSSTWNPAREDSATYLYTGETSAIITSVTYETKENFDGISVTGHTLNALMERRIVWGLFTMYGRFTDIMKRLIDVCMINPSDPNRKLPNIKLIELPTATGSNIGYQRTGGYLLDALYDMMLETDWGVTTFYDWYQQTIWIYFYKGINRSVDQTSVPRVVLTRENLMLINPMYEDDATFYKSTALVAGSGEGEARIHVSIGNDQAQWDRNEVYFDARDVQPIDENGQEIPPEQYNAMLTRRGYDRLKEYIRSKIFQSEISLDGTYVYNRDFYVGDIVTVNDTFTGVHGTLRIEAMETSADSNGKLQRITIGEDKVTFQQRIKSALR